MVGCSKEKSIRVAAVQMNCQVGELDATLAKAEKFIREDLEVSHRSVTNWLNILEKFYYHFRIYPFARDIIRSIKKEPKLYLCDWSEVESSSCLSSYKEIRN